MRKRILTGFSLIEVLVAITIFTVLMIAALKVYDQSQRSYILGEQQADVQQNIRFAFEKITAELRLAGYDFNHDADAMRPDEQLEGIWPGAIAYRANFDPDNDENRNQSSPDPTYIDKNNPLFNVVTTTNQEIHVLVLSKDPTQSLAGSNESLTFHVDLTKPRDDTLSTLGNQESVTISNISLTQNKPPYTLYRVSWPDTSEPRSPVFTPLATNIHSLNFTYYDQWGVDPTHEIDPDSFNGNIIQGEESVDARKTRGYIFNSGSETPFVKNVVIEIIGMVGRDDPAYTDPNDLNPDTKHRRKYELSATVQMFNIGVLPHELEDITPPYPPTNLVAYPGYCNGILVTFTPSPSNDVAQYVFHWRDTAGIYVQPFPEDDPAHAYFTSSWDFSGSTAVAFIPARLLGFDASGTAQFAHFQNGQSYTLRAFALDGAENFSEDVSNETTVVLNPNPPKPNGPDTIFTEEIVGTDGFNHAQVAWTTAAGYDSCQVGVDPNPANGIRDFLGFRIHRLINPDPDANLDGTYELLAMEQVVRGIKYPDLKACPCEDYAYKIQTITNCQNNYDDNVCSGGTGVSDISDRVLVTIPPLDASGTEIPAKPALTYATYDNIPSTDDYNIELHWEPVHATTPSNLEVSPIKYYIYESGPHPNNQPVPDPPDDPLDLDGDLSDGVFGPAVIDSSQLSVSLPLSSFLGPRTIPSDQRMYYWVQGIFDCDTPVLGEFSDAAAVPCEATWTPQIIYPANDGDSVSGMVNIQLQIDNPDSIVFQYVKLRIYNIDTFSLQQEGDMVFDGMRYIYGWDTSAMFAGNYMITIGIMDANNCFVELRRYASVAPACVVLVTPLGVCADDPTAVCFTIEAPPDKEYLMNGLVVAGSGNYRMVELWGSDVDGTYLLYTSTHPLGDIISGGLPIYDFESTNFPAYPGLFKLSSFSNITEYRFVFNDAVDISNGVLDLYLGELDIIGVSGATTTCVSMTGNVSISKQNQSDWPQFGTPPICGGSGNGVAPCCDPPVVYDAGTLITEGIHYAIDHAAGTIDWVPLIPRSSSETHDLEIVYFNEVVDATWESYICTSIPLLLGP